MGVDLGLQSLCSRQSSTRINFNMINDGFWRLLQFILDEPSWSRDESDVLWVPTCYWYVVLSSICIYLYLVCCSHARVRSAWLQAIQVMGNMTHLKLWCPGSLRNCSISNVKEIRSAVPTIGATLILFSTSLSIPSPSSLGNMNIMDKLFPQFPSFTASCTTTSWAWRMALACNAVNRHNRAQTVKWLAKNLGHGRYHLFLQWNWWIFIPSWPASLRPKAIETVSGVGENSNSPNKICRGRRFFTDAVESWPLKLAPEIGIRRSLAPKNLGQFLFGAVSFDVFPMSFEDLGLLSPKNLRGSFSHVFRTQNPSLISSSEPLMTSMFSRPMGASLQWGSPLTAIWENSGSMMGELSELWIFHGIIILWIILDI